MNNNMCKVAFIFVTSTVLGGAERRLTRVFSRIDGVDILVCSLGSTQEVHASLTKFAEHNPKCIICVGNMSDVTKRLWKEKYDYVVFFNYSGRMLPVPVTAKLSGSKVLWLLVNYDISNLAFKNTKDAVLFTIFRVFADKVDCLYPGRTLKLKQKIGKDVPITETPLPSTDTSKFTPKRKRKIIVFAARLTEGKGVLEFVDALVLCKNSLVEHGYCVMICGEGNLKEKVIESIKSHDLGRVVQIEGYRDMENILPYTRVFMSLQENENYPSQSLLEAISSGCWCIATNVGNTHLLVKPEFGELVKGTSVNIAQAVHNAMLMTDNQFETISISARNFAEANFDINASINHYKRIFSERE